MGYVRESCELWGQESEGESIKLGEEREGGERDEGEKRRNAKRDARKRSKRPPPLSLLLLLTRAELPCPAGDVVALRLEAGDGLCVFPSFF